MPSSFSSFKNLANVRLGDLFDGFDNEAFGAIKFPAVPEANDRLQQLLAGGNLPEPAQTILGELTPLIARGTTLAELLQHVDRLIDGLPASDVAHASSQAEGADASASSSASSSTSATSGVGDWPAAPRAQRGLPPMLAGLAKQFVRPVRGGGMMPGVRPVRGGLRDEGTGTT
jgi:hypothetical protein